MNGCCVVAGSNGIVGRALIEYLGLRRDCSVVALSRHTVQGNRHRAISVDLLNPAECDQKLCGLTDVQYLFYAAYAPGASPAEEVATNTSMFRNLVTTIDLASPSLARVVIVQGSKWYGNHLGPYRTPAREDDSRHGVPLFYYDQQDWIEAQQQSKPWTWSAVRPHGIFGIAPTSPMNHLLALAIYASICRELDRPFDFPGTAGAFGAINQFTDAGLLARAIFWAASAPRCANQAFNITNGDFDRWSNIWPFVTRWFGNRPGAVGDFDLAEFMADKDQLWARMVKKYRLRATRLADLVDWRFANWSYRNEFDQMSSMVKARQSGWNEATDMTTMLETLFTRAVSERFIPDWKST